MRMRAAILAALFLVACGGATVPAITPSPTPAQAPDAATVVQRLKAAGLPIGEMLAYTAESDPNKLLGRPDQYVTKAAFRDTRLPAGAEMGVDAGGGVETFAAAADVQARKAYIEDIGRRLPAAVEYDYSAGLVLLRVAKALTPDQAAAYQRALVAAAK